MINLFLQTAELGDEVFNGMVAGGAIAGLVGFIAAFFVLFLLIGIGVYVYSSLAFARIGKRAGLSNPNLAWIPGIGPLINAFRISKMHWWPWLLLIAYFIPILNFFAMILFAVYSVIWMWKMFEAIGRPGWWILLGLIPFAGGIIMLVLIGIAAWGEPETMKRNAPMRTAVKKKTVKRRR